MHLCTRCDVLCSNDLLASLLCLCALDAAYGFCVGSCCFAGQHLIITEFVSNSCVALCLSLPIVGELFVSRCYLPPLSRFFSFAWYVFPFPHVIQVANLQPSKDSPSSTISTGAMSSPGKPNLERKETMSPGGQKKPPPPMQIFQVCEIIHWVWSCYFILDALCFWYYSCELLITFWSIDC